MQKDKKRSTSEFFLLLICDSVNFKQKIKVCRWFIMAVNENCNSFFFSFSLKDLSVLENVAANQKLLLSCQSCF